MKTVRDIYDMSKLTHSTKGRRPTYATDLPVYDSMEIAEANTGIPKEAFQLAIKQGCLCKKHGRIHLGEFIRWWFNRDESDEEGTNWKSRGERASTMLKELQVFKEQKESVSRSKAERFIGWLTATFFGELERAFTVFPSSLVGKKEVEISKECTDEQRRIEKSIRFYLDRWIAMKGDYDAMGR